MNTTTNKLADLLARVRDFMESALAEGPHADNLAHYDAEIAAALAEHDAAPTAFDVMFQREVHDEVFDGRKTTEAERFDQLAREIHEADPELPLTLRGCITTGEHDTFLVRTAHAGDVRSLRDRLQASYDSHGVAGFFQIGADA